MNNDSNVLALQNPLNLEITDNVAAWALEYLMDNRPYDCLVRYFDDCVVYQGFGDRALVVPHQGPMTLSMFRRFEYRWLAERKDTAIDIKATIERFRKRANDVTLENAEG